jgi:CBS domain-containing protein
MSSVGEIMTEDPVCLDESASVRDAAGAMRDEDIGDVVVTRQGRAHGILTDRDIVVRCLADGSDVDVCTCGEVCSTEIVGITADAPLDQAVQLMRQYAVRRLVVTEDDRPIGIVSIGDLAVERDRTSALGDISAAAPNH